MAGPRINQFADDLGINRSSAKKLLKKARGRKDGGSETLEKHMPGKKYTGPMPKTRSGKDDTEYNMRFKEARAAHLRRKQKEEMKEGVKAKDGKYMTCGGMRKAVGGGKFTGVY
tara:strand:- start:126 stop:467 length:342 start_codon:yes stop_codon:yes gene_type:complete